MILSRVVQFKWSPCFSILLLVHLTNCFRWFGLILLPLLSFAADGILTIRTFIHSLIQYFFKGPEPPSPMAKARAIDLSIQFMLFWTPFLVLLAWGMGTPLSLLFGTCDLGWRVFTSNTSTQISSRYRCSYALALLSIMLRQIQKLTGQKD